MTEDSKTVMNPLALDALTNGQRQLDQDGVMVGVSRQALDELLAAYAALAAAPVNAMSGEESDRFHFTNEHAVEVTGADGTSLRLGTGWLAISEAEYASLRPASELVAALREGEGSGDTHLRDCLFWLENTEGFGNLTEVHTLSALVRRHLSQPRHIAKLWQDILEKDDRTSPAEYPDMCLISFDEFAAALAQTSGVAASLPTAGVGVPEGNELFNRAMTAVRDFDEWAACNETMAEACSEWPIPHDEFMAVKARQARKALSELKAWFPATPIEGVCNHLHYDFSKHGRRCTCGAMMHDFGD